MPTESEIQSQILAWLREQAIWHRRVPIGAVKHAGIRKRSPLTGMPDLMGIIPKTEGRLFCIEVKTDSGKLSQIQKETIAELESNGVLVIVARNLQDVVSVLLSRMVS